MTYLQKEKVLNQIRELVQRLVNGHEYLHFREVDINHCGGYSIEIYDVCLLHDDDVLAIIAICKMNCVQFRLYLDEGIINLL